jgi:hypothetical protein
MVAAPGTGQRDSVILVLPGSNDVVLPPAQRITLTPAISVPPAATTVAALTVPEGAKLSFTGLADITLPAGSRVCAVGEPKNEVTLPEERQFSLPFAGEVISQLWSLLLASCFTMFGIGADLAIVGWVLGYDLAAAPLWGRALIAAVASVAALIVVWYGVFAIRALATRGTARC